MQEKEFSNLLEYLVWQTHETKPLKLCAIFNQGLAYHDITVQPNVFIYLVHIDTKKDLHVPKYQLNAIVENIQQLTNRKQPLKITKKERIK